MKLRLRHGVGRWSRMQSSILDHRHYRIGRWNHGWIGFCSRPSYLVSVRSGHGKLSRWWRPNRSRVNAEKRQMRQHIIFKSWDTITGRRTEKCVHEQTRKYVWHGEYLNSFVIVLFYWFRSPEIVLTAFFMFYIYTYILAGCPKIKDA